MTKAEAAVIPFAASADETKITEMAQLSPLEYEKCREPEAKNMGVRLSTLDQMVSEERLKLNSAETDSPFQEEDIWAEDVDGAILLSELLAVINRFCVLPEHSDILMAIWVLHAWTHDAADISPILAFVSPEKRCGKTTALSVIGVLVPRAMHNVNVTTSVLFRVVEKYCPTILIDEGDTYLTDNDELRGILNGGHNRYSAFVWRSVGDDHEPRRFKVWAPKCIAMIGKLPDTIDDRALVVPLRRKRVGETVERFRADRMAEFQPLRQRAQRWSRDNIMQLRGMDPKVPNVLNDRAQDNARAICAIADLVGGEWPIIVRNALVGLAGQTKSEPQSSGELLLRDIREVLSTWSSSRIGSKDLCQALCDLEDAPWGEWWNGKPITSRRISTMLKPYGLSPKRDRFGSFYSMADFSDAFNRYALDASQEAATSATTATVPQSTTEKLNKNNSTLQNDSCGSSECIAEYRCPDMSETATSEWEGEF